MNNLVSDAIEKRYGETSIQTSPCEMKPLQMDECVYMMYVSAYLCCLISQSAVDILALLQIHIPKYHFSFALRKFYKFYNFTFYKNHIAFSKPFF